MIQKDHMILLISRLLQGLSAAKCRIDLNLRTFEQTAEYPEIHIHIIYDQNFTRRS